MSFFPGLSWLLGADETSERSWSSGPIPTPRDEGLEALIDKAGRDEVFARARANGWIGPAPTFVWNALAMEILAEKQQAALVDHVARAIHYGEAQHFIPGALGFDTLDADRQEQYREMAVEAIKAVREKDPAHD